MTQYLTVPLEVKALGANELEGHGSVFRNVDLGGDIVVPGAFKRSLSRHKKEGTLPQMFWMHDPSRVPGKWTDMVEDDYGLQVRGVLADTELGREMRTLAQMKAVRGLSIGYQIADADYDGDGNRLLKEVDLWEVSLVSLAMNPLARIEAAKSRLSRDGEYVPTEREFERCLRDAGYSRKVATTLAARVFDSADPRGILDGHLRDAGASDEEEARAALAGLAGKLYGMALR
jgi:HK97 family phage prohead protease